MMVKRDPRRVRRQIELDFFAALNDWLNHNDVAGAIRRLDGTAEAAKDIRLTQVHDILRHVAFSIKDGESLRALAWGLRHFVGTHPHSFTGPVLCLQGLCYLRLNDYPMAIKVLEKALRTNGFHCLWVAHQALGIAFYHSGDYADARNALIKAAAFDEHPHPGSVWLNLGEVYWRLGDTVQAESAYRKAADNLRDPYQREYVRMKLEDVDAQSIERLSDILPVAPGTVFEQGLERFVDGLLKEKIVGTKKEKSLRLRAELLAREYELDVKTRRMLERFSPQIVAEVVRQFRDKEAGIHRGRLLEEQVARKRQHLTILKASIHGFTAHFKYLDGEDQIQFINDFLRRIASTIFRHNGAIDRIWSTGVVAYFGHMNTGSEGQAHRMVAKDAVDTAFAIQEELIAFFKEVKKHFFELPVERIRREKGGYDLRERTLGLAMGLSTGWCNFGQMVVGDKNDRLMMGHAVNIAHRLTEIAKPREILTSQTTYELLDALPGADYDFEDISARVEVDGHTRLTTMKDYENRPVYRLFLPGDPEFNGNGK